ncbi:hypothetical protein M407DRAFT_24711 [Tulasnella calospora MUT 4182]|uniref:Uncharacterized protein n=1 Tax=Tulasnella calospora MUT 4182 TaxID=1051891 RepID=A0A0C3QHE4_9AGAM|nr:hypothetical protein M407DRAFT_24711 [Tulasnella calospora MUT 4182]
MIGIFVSWAAFICLTTVLCVIWRIRVARERKNSERASNDEQKKRASHLTHPTPPLQSTTNKTENRLDSAGFADDDRTSTQAPNGDDHDNDGTDERHEPATSKGTE